MDDNYKTDHVQLAHPSEDEWLGEGGGMTPCRDEYKEFLLHAMETCTLESTMQKHIRAITNAVLASKSCDIMGIMAIACAQHRCFVPNAMVDLFRNEQQKNIDFVILRAIEKTDVDPDQGLLLMYDIICQYIIHLQDWIGEHLPPGLTIDWAIGMFHVHCHKEQCFFRYVPSLIPGAAIMIREILESL